MIWAVDLDDGTYINALGEGFDRAKKNVLPDPGFWALSDMGSDMLPGEL
jgi:hypothetical protein